MLTNEHLCVMMYKNLNPLGGITMKKILAIMFCVLLIVSLSACGGGESQTDKSSQSNDISNQSSEIVSEDNNQSDSEWKQFLNDYEKWVDDYIVILDKYNKNPKDMSILSDYTEMMNEMADWTSRADKVKEELKNSPEALKEYSDELARIASKLADAAN